jgi:mRNA interferase RelE/StbE
LVWEIEFRPSARKAFDKLYKSVQKKILAFLKKIIPLESSCAFGKALSHDKQGLWRYCIENHRIICQIDDSIIKIVIVKVGHRKEVYDE